MYKELLFTGALVFLTGCASTSPDGAIELKENLPPAAQAPGQLPAGTKIVRIENDDKEITQTVLSVKDIYSSYSDTNGWSWTTENFWVPPTSWEGPNGEYGTQTVSGDTGLFPLKVGKKITMSYSGKNQKGNFTGKRRCAVESAERISVRAGEFDTYKIECKQGSDLAKPWRTRTYHYSPELQMTVRLHNKHKDKPARIIELAEVIPGFQ